ncbi:cilia- and flagella-associated protein 90 [Neoarius graeffei]|uniref:cilia- and flagella-associated protein 90 n=1 Tax=Neoarius graeffei TaxID=443677 RepID=UPI00298C23C4|nr:cilia- and flagella-associated protein 90 [Neoarius graeffei]
MDELIKSESKPVCALSVYSFIPPRRTEPKEIRFFNSCSQAPDRSVYDCIYRRAEGYDMKLHRDDREHDKGRGLEIYQEECIRPVPVRSSSEYGRWLPLLSNQSNRKFARVSHVHREFYRRNGISKSVEEGYGSVVPV